MRHLERSAEWYLERVWNSIRAIEDFPDGADRVAGLARAARRDLTLALDELNHRG